MLLGLSPADIYCQNCECLLSTEKHLWILSNVAYAWASPSAGRAKSSGLSSPRRADTASGDLGSGWWAQTWSENSSSMRAVMKELGCSWISLPAHFFWVLWQMRAWRGPWVKSRWWRHTAAFHTSSLWKGVKVQKYSSCPFSSAALMQVYLLTLGIFYFSPSLLSFLVPSHSLSH